MVAAFNESLTERSKFLEGQNESLMMKVEQSWNWKWNFH